MKEKFCLGGTDWLYEYETDSKLLGNSRPVVMTQIRYVLGEVNVNSSSNKVLICIGANPSTAIPGALDATVTRVRKYAQNNEYAAWYMVNLYPWRATNPDDMKTDDEDRDLRGEIHKMNIKSIKSLIDRLVDEGKSIYVWKAWGDVIKKRAYLTCMRDDIEGILKLYDGKLTFLSFGVTNSGNPIHPLARTKSV